jgi:hypothetical protein
VHLAHRRTVRDGARNRASHLLHVRHGRGPAHGSHSAWPAPAGTKSSPQAHCATARPVIWMCAAARKGAAEAEAPAAKFWEETP